MSVVMLVAISRLLGSVQSAARRSYDAGVFTGLKLRPLVTAELADAMRLWHDGPFDVSSLITRHLQIDTFLLVPWYCVLILLALRHLSQGHSLVVWMVAGGLFLADLLENAATYYILVRGNLDTSRPGLLQLLQLVSLTKWLFLIAALVMAVALSVKPRAGGRNALDRWLDAIRAQPTRGMQHPGPALLDVFLVVALFAALVALPAGGPLEQLPDVLRYWLSRAPGRLVLLLLLLTWAVVAAGLASTLPIPRRYRLGDAWRAHTLIVGAAVLSLLLGLTGFIVDGETTWVPASSLLVVLGLAVAAGLAKAAAHAVSEGPKPGEPPKVTEPPADLDPDRARRQRWIWVGGLGGLVVVVSGLGLVRAAFPPWLLSLEGWSRWKALTLVGIAMAVLGGLLTQWVVLQMEPAASDDTPRRGVRQTLAVGVVLVVLAGWLTYHPGHPSWLGTAGVAMIAFALLAIAVGLLKGCSRILPPWSVTYHLGFTRGTPWLALLVSTWVVGSAVNVHGVYHDVRLTSDSVPYAPRYPDLDSAFGAWLGAQTGPCGGHGRPMVLVAAPGGGIRAAYWTAAVLDTLFGTTAGPCAARGLFALSGVSGGSVGATAWMAVTTTADGMEGKDLVAKLADDHALAATVTGFFLRDFLQPFTGITTLWRDRAALLEDAWTESAEGAFGSTDHPLEWGDLGKDLEMRLGWRPVLVLNASSVTDGCRLLLSNVGRLPAAPGTDCAAGPSEGPAGGPVSAAIDPFPGLYGRPYNGIKRPAYWRERFRPQPRPAAATTPEPGCPPPNAGLRAVAAALLSARFAAVAPSGALLRCLRDSVPDSLVTYAVDGGYYENSGLLTLLQVWAAVEPRVRHYNCSHAAADSIVPWIVLIDNHYRSGARTAPSKRPREVFVPLRARGNNVTLGQQALEEMAGSAIDAERRRCRPLEEQPASSPDSTKPLLTYAVIAPNRQPSVAAPLGWVLSKASRVDLDGQLTRRIGRAKAPLAAATRDARLAELLRQLDP